MTTAIFSGGSDDLVDITGCEGADEFNVHPGSGPVGYAGTWAVVDPETNDGIRVHAFFDRQGVWSFAVAQMEDEDPIPPWEITILQSDDGRPDDPRYYSTQVVIRSPGRLKVARL